MQRLCVATALVIAMALGSAATQRADAQSAVVRIRVSDTSGAALSAATVSIVSGDRVIASGRTDSTGVELRIGAAATTLGLVVQHLGYLGTRRVLATKDPLVIVAIALAPVPAALDTVRVAGRGTKLDAQPFIRADEIAATKRGVFDFFDVLKKLRPELLDHIGDDMRYKCIPNSVTGSLRIYINERPVPKDAMDVLYQVKSDAIEELRYVSCRDKSIAPDDSPQVGHIYVTLKKSFGFALNRGTFAKDTAVVHAQAATDTTPLRPSSARVVGVYDAISGTPIEGADVVNLLNGYSSKTTRTGTVALAYVDPIGAMIKIERTGYVPLVMPVTNGANDPPLTITLTPRGKSEPRLARLLNPADSVRKLLVSGFYERRDTMPVPAGAVLERDAIARFTRMADVAAGMHRPICQQNLLIDGARVAGDADTLVSPAMIVGIETYEGTEVPAEPFRDVGATPRCVTLIWTR